MTETWSWTIEAFLSAAWTDISADVLRMETISARRGISGTDVTDRVASPGSFTFSLDNSANNSGGKLGYYSPGHADCRTGWGKDTRVRLKIVSGASTKYFIHAWVDEVELETGKFRGRSVRVTATDYMRWLQRELELLTVQQNRRPDQLISTAIGAVPTAPLHTSYATDPATWSLGFHLERDEKTAYLGLMQSICKSSLGYLYVAGNATDGETLTYQHRYSRTGTTVAATLNDIMDDVDVALKGSRVRNHVRGTVYPVRVDTTYVVLASITEEIVLRPGETRSINLRVRDPDGQDRRVSGMSYVDPLVAITDYMMSSHSGDGKGDLNSFLTFPASTFGANTIYLSIRNTSAVQGYLNFLQVRGKGLYAYDPIDVIAESGAADISYNFPMPYQADVNVGQDFVEHVLANVSGSDPLAETVTFRPDFSSTLMGYLMSVEIGARVSIVETVSGVNATYTINEMTLTIERGKLLTMEWKLTPAEDVRFFTLDDATLGQLNEPTNKLGF